MSELSRREFMKGSARTGAGAALGLGAISLATRATANSANDTVRVAVIGIKGRGGSHIDGLGGLKNVEIATLCDIDERVVGGRMKEFERRGWKTPKVETDLRRVMEDKDIDVISIATPNHWHALASIWACEAGKDVYVEKPCSHNVWEGRQLVNAAKKYNRIVQHGTQIRSNPSIQEAMQHLRDGLIGEVYMARGLCYKRRASIGKKPPTDVPKGVNYDLWQGPGPEGQFTENRFHYNWHWTWDFGNGDIGNQGVHQMDLCRWGLGVGLPKHVATTAHMVLFDDDKEVPNLINTSFLYPDEGVRGKIIDFDVRPWHTNDEKGAKIGALFYGSEGYMVIDSYEHYQTYLGDREEKGPGGSKGGDHYANFIDAVRTRNAASLNAPIEEGHLSSALCHLGLISARLGRSFEFDPSAEKVVGDEEAGKLLTRSYREPYVVTEIKV